MSFIIFHILFSSIVFLFLSIRRDGRGHGRLNDQSLKKIAAKEKNNFFFFLI